jgi:hypothetical protein
MMRLLMAAMIAFLGVVSAVAGGFGAGGVVDLDAPGALEALKKGNPSHYDTICKIMTGLRGKTKSEIPRWMQKNFRATNVSYANVDVASIFLTSDPPKLRLFFTLDGQDYRTLMTLTNIKREVIPANGLVHLLKNQGAKPDK